MTDPNRIIWIISREFKGKEVVARLTQERVEIARILALYPLLRSHIQEDTILKVIRHDKYGECLHVETPLGVVNIRVGLSDKRGRAVDSIEVLPKCYAGEPKVVLHGRHNTRLVELKGVKR